MGIVDETPHHVRFMHRVPADLELHAAYFRCPIEFNADHDELVFDRKFLDYPTGGKIDVFEPMLDYFVRYKFRNAPTMPRTVTNSVALAIASILGTNQSPICSVAETMGVHPKKLQRLLDRDGVTFSGILDDVRKDTAKRMLTGSDVSVARIAALLDYASNPPFTLAFTRWTGMSPRAFRDRQRRKGGILAQSTPAISGSGGEMAEEPA